MVKKNLNMAGTVPTLVVNTSPSDGNGGHDQKPAADLLLTVNEVANILHVHRNTVRRWHRQGVLKAWRVGPRRDRRFRMEDIKVLMSLT